MAQEQSNGGGELLDPCSHVLVVAYALQGHLNPARTLARRLARTTGCKATLAVQLCGYRRMFPSRTTTNHHSSDEVELETSSSDGVISYVPFSDGRDDGSWPKDAAERAQSHDATFRSLSAVADRLAATAVVCTLSMPVVCQVARARGVPLAVYWIQPATTLAAYYHYFHGYGDLVRARAAEPAHEVRFPGGGMRPLRIRDMPSFFTEAAPGDLSVTIMQAMRELFREIDQGRPVVLVNTFGALESAAMEAMKQYMDVVAVGPVVPPLPALLHHRQQQVVTDDEDEAQIHLFKQDEKDYMKWLDTQPETSVVYLSFGSMIRCSKRQLEEIMAGLEACGRPYLWVVRRDQEDSDLPQQEQVVKKGVVVEWCDQLQVLLHPSVGCFVTHCGWNSALEAVVCGVPMVAAPCWSDQPLNARLVEEWGVGVRAARDAEGVLTREELVRGVEMVMGDGERAMEVRENAASMRKKAQDVLGTGGQLEMNLIGFVDRIQDQRGALDQQKR